MRLVTTLFFALLMGCLINQSIAADTLYSPVKNYVTFTINNTSYARDLSSRIEACTDNMLRMYDMVSDTLRKAIQIPPSNSIWLRTLSYEPDSSGYVIVSADTGFLRVNIESGTFVTRRFSTEDVLSNSDIYYSADFDKMIYRHTDSLYYMSTSSGEPPKRIFSKHGRQNRSIAFYPDNKRIVTLYPSDSTMHIWDAGADTILFTSHLTDVPGQGVAVSNSGDKIIFTLSSSNSRKYAIANGATYEILVIDSVATGESPKYWSKGVGTMVQFSSDDSKVMIGDSWPFTCIIDIPTMKEVYSFGPQNDDNIRHRWFNSDSTVIINAYNLGTRKDMLYELNANKFGTVERYVKQERPRVVYSSFSGKGEPLFSGRYNYTIYSAYESRRDFFTYVFWNGETGKEFMKRTDIEQPSGIGNRELEFYFSPDGTRWFNAVWNTAYDDIYQMDINIFNMADTGQMVAGPFIGSRSAISQDRKYLCEFSEDSMKIADAYTGNITRLPFKLDYTWKPYVFDPSQNIICACSTKQAGSHSSEYVAGIWNYSTGAFVNSFSLGVKAESYRSDIPRIMIVPNKMQLIVANSSSVIMYDIQTGEKVQAYTYNNSGVLNTTLTPDGNQLINGNCCYLTSTGELLRVYQGMTVSDYVSFNPINNSQFIAGSKVWELPVPIKISTRSDLKKKSQVITCHADSRKLAIYFPSANGDNATVRLYQPNGRCVNKIDFMIHNKNSGISFPRLAQGIYLYRLDVPSNSIRTQGKFTVY